MISDNEAISITQPQPPSHGNQKISTARQQCASHSNTKDDAKFNTVMKYLNIDLHTSQMHIHIYMESHRVSSDSRAMVVGVE